MAGTGGLHRSVRRPPIWFLRRKDRRTPIGIGGAALPLLTAYRGVDLPVNGSGVASGTTDAVRDTDLSDLSPPWLVKTNNEYVFTCVSNGATTTGSTFPRCELRNDTDIPWDTGTRMKVKVKVKATSGTETIILQSLDNVSGKKAIAIDFTGGAAGGSAGRIRVQYRQNSNDASTQTPVVLLSNIPQDATGLSDPFTVEIVRYARLAQVNVWDKTGALAATWSSGNGTDVPFIRTSSDGSYYWKCGNYLQDNTASPVNTCVVYQMVGTLPTFQTITVADPVLSLAVPDLSAQVGVFYNGFDFGPYFANFSEITVTTLPAGWSMSPFGVITPMTPGTSQSATNYTLTAYALNGHSVTDVFALDIAAAAVNNAPVGGSITLNFDVLNGTVPSNTAVPTISGTAQVTQVLTAADGTWSNGAGSFTRKWQRSADGSTGWTDISGATGTTYTLQSADLNNYVRVLVTGSNLAGAGTATPSAASAQVASGFTQPDLATGAAGVSITNLAETQTIRNFVFATKFKGPLTAANTYLLASGVDTYFRAASNLRETFRVKEKTGNTQFINSNPVPAAFAANTETPVFVIAYDDGTNYTWEVVINGSSFASGSGASPGADWFIPTGINKAGTGTTSSTDMSMRGFWFGQAASLPGTKPTYSDFFDGSGNWKDIFILSAVAGFTPSAKWGGTLAALNALGISAGTWT